MSRIFTDQHLETWEVFSTGGQFGLPEQPKIVLQPRTQFGARARYVRHDGDSASAQRVVLGLSDEDFRRMLAESMQLE